MTIRPSVVVIAGAEAGRLRDCDGGNAGTKPVAQIRTTIPGLILMDMNYTRSTTGEEGLELLAKVKVLAPEVPVILITAWGSIHLAVQGIRAGAFDFITKPWNNLALLESIRTAIQVQESSTAADAAPKSPFRRDKIIASPRSWSGSCKRYRASPPPMLPC